MARALIDADMLGDTGAARKHGVHFNTIANWRKRWGSTPAVRRVMNTLRERASRGWIEQGRDARLQLVAKVAEIAGRARSVKDLKAVTDALRRIHEVVLSHEILGGAETKASDQRDEPDQPRDEPPAPSAG